MSGSSEQQTASSRHLWAHFCWRLWQGLLFLWLTVVLGLALNIGATWLMTKDFDPKGTPLGFIIQHLPVAMACGGILLILTVVAGVLGWQKDSSTSQLQPSRSAQESRGALIHLLRNEYRRQMAESLQGVTMMALVLQQRTDVTLSSVSLVSWRMDTPGETSLPAPTSIVQAYDDAGSGLLILGAPGAGKSTLLRELASELVIRAQQNIAEPIPVIVNLSSWAIKKSPLSVWLVDQLELIYAIPRHLSQRWIELGQLLLLLDGLDEMESSARANCVEAINAYRTEHFVPLVVCSRSQEYLAQEGRLRLPIAVEVRPLTPEQIDSYLKAIGKPLAAVRAALRHNAALRNLVTTPLMLSVFMLAYRGKTAKDLPQMGSAEDQKRQVFDHYTIRMLEQQTRKWYFTSQQTRQWLIWLAQQMRQRHLTEFYLERLQSTWLPTKQLQTFYHVLSGLTGGLTGGLLVGLVAGLLVGLVFGLFYGLLVGPLFGLFYGLLVGPLFGLFVRLSIRKREISSQEFLKRSSKDGRRGLVVRLLFGLVFELSIRKREISSQEILKWSWKDGRRRLLFGLLGGLVYGLLFGLHNGLRFGLFAGLFAGPLFGLTGGLVFGLSSEQLNEDMRVTPNQGIHSSGRNALRMGLLVGLVYGLLFGLLGGLLAGLLAGLHNGLVLGLLAGLLAGLVLGLLVGLLFGGIDYLGHYLLRYVLWRHGMMPWFYVRFLEEACERILLQRVGAGYRFIHPLFLDYFASLCTSAPPPSAQPPPS